MSQRAVRFPRDTIASDLMKLQERGDVTIKLLFAGRVDVEVRTPAGREVSSYGRDLSSTLRNSLNSLNRMEPQ